MSSQRDANCPILTTAPQLWDGLKEPLGGGWSGVTSGCRKVCGHTDSQTRGHGWTEGHRQTWRCVQAQGCVWTQGHGDTSGHRDTTTSEHRPPSLPTPLPAPHGRSLKPVIFQHLPPQKKKKKKGKAMRAPLPPIPPGGAAAPPWIQAGGAAPHAFTSPSRSSQSSAPRTRRTNLSRTRWWWGAQPRPGGTQGSPLPPHLTPSARSAANHESPEMRKRFDFIFALLSSTRRLPLAERSHRSSPNHHHETQTSARQKSLFLLDLTKNRCFFTCFDQRAVQKNHLFLLALTKVGRFSLLDQNHRFSPQQSEAARKERVLCR